MKKFTVTHIACGSYAKREIEADYYTIQNGILSLRLFRRGPGEYPVTLVAYADGCWRSIEVTP